LKIASEVEEVNMNFLLIGACKFNVQNIIKNKMKKHHMGYLHFWLNPHTWKDALLCFLQDQAILGGVLLQ
jgi:hypothetical protein